MVPSQDFNAGPPEYGAEDGSELASDSNEERPAFSILKGAESDDSGWPWNHPSAVPDAGGHWPGEVNVQVKGREGRDCTST
jgi:hypothetical protein